jgi:hypothetical protein
VAYDIRTDTGPELDRAELVLWVEGTFVKGYLRFFEIDAESVLDAETYLMTGTLENGELWLVQCGLEDSVVMMSSATSVVHDRTPFKQCA